MTNEELAIGVQEGKQGCIEALWLQCERLIELMAYRWKRYRPDNAVDVEDLKQSGYFALRRAANAFDQQKGFKFTTYLNSYCRNEFRAVLGLRTSKRDAMLYAISLDAPISGDDGEDRTLEGEIPDLKAEQQFEEAEDQDFRRIVRNTIRTEASSLTQKQREALESVFFKGQSQTSVSDMVGVSSQAISQQCGAALRVLRQKTAIQTLYQTITGRDDAPDIESLGLSKTGAGAFAGSGESATERAAFLCMRYEEERKRRTERTPPPPSGDCTTRRSSTDAGVQHSF